jgi:hypothetical protein
VQFTATDGGSRDPHTAWMLSVCPSHRSVIEGLIHDQVRWRSTVTPAPPGRIESRPASRSTVIRFTGFAYVR